jgi:flagellar motility protein MotE (MotC chaperone)
MLRPARVRILPILIFIAVLFLGFRINHFIAVLSGAVNPDMFLQKADAADPKAEKPAAEPKAENTPAEPKTESTAAKDTKTEAAGEKAPAEAKPEGAEHAAAEGGKEGKAEKKTPEQELEELKIKPKIYETQPDDLAAADRKILEELGILKTEIQDKKQALDEREVLLQVTEKRVDEKISELQALKNQIETILGKLDQEQKEKILSLVKIYEAMKPKDAARIFDNLEMDVLIEVADHMKEARLAPIMAKMNDGKAKSLTRLMAERKKFSG